MMTTRKLAGGLTLAALLGLPQAGGAQQPKVEPLRVLAGVMTGKEITVQSSTPSAGFAVSLTRVEVREGRLHFFGRVARGGRARGRETDFGVLLGTMGMASNPWPSANQQRARRRADERSAENREEVNEQTQSLYTPMDAGSGCEILYVKTAAGLPRAAPMQLGVTLAPVDNPLGQKLNQRICRIVRALNAGKQGEADAAVAELNRLLAE